MYLYAHVDVVGIVFTSVSVVELFIMSGSPLLWIYDDAVLRSAITGHPDTPEFHEPSANPYYHVPTGALSHYGDQIIPILRSLAECKGNFSLHVHEM